MYLSEMGPNTRIKSYSDLGSHDMDRNYDWINEAQNHYSNNDIANAQEFVRQSSSNNNITDSGGKDDSRIDYQTLNEKQTLIFVRIKTHYNNIIQYLDNRLNL